MMLVIRLPRSCLRVLMPCRYRGTASLSPCRRLRLPLERWRKATNSPLRGVGRALKPFQEPRPPLRNVPVVPTMQTPWSRARPMCRLREMLPPQLPQMTPVAGVVRRRYRLWIVPKAASTAKHATRCTTPEPVGLLVKGINGEIRHKAQ